ncbi:MAG: DNA primase, partial [Oscillospiraceae bacterium]|nr:DNA primase [Oscillospiraceae bacterium]
MAIPQSFIQQLVAACDIESIISSYVNLSRDGRNKKCLCPFHSEKTASMVVYSNTQSFYCFGCGAGGDVITFIMKIENLSYIEAIRFLANRVGMAIPEDDYSDKTSYLRSRVLEINRETAKFFHACLKSPAGKVGLDYLLSRELTPQTITKYGLGFAPDGWDNLRKHLHSKGFTDEEMLEAAVVAKSAKGRVYDQFRNRVMFPIIDLRGNVIAFGGRVMDDSKPKYLNSSDTPVFKKSRNLFSLNFAKNVKSDRLILAEGYMDVIAINQGGFENVVATLGTALTPEQARLIASYAKEVVIAYDSDQAGQIATKRAVALLEQVGISAKVLSITGAKDPDEFIKKFGSTRFKMLLDGANNATDFEILKLKNEFDLTTEDGKYNFTKKALELLSELSDPISQEIYAGKISAETSIARDTIIEQVKSLCAKKRRIENKKQWRDIQSGKQFFGDRINPQKATNLKETLAEEGLIASLILIPDSQGKILSEIDENFFVTDFNRKVFTFIANKLAVGSNFDFSMLSAEFLPDQMGKISSMIAQFDDKRIDTAQIDDYVNVLKAHKEKITPDQAGQMSDDEFLKYAQQLKNKKK